MSDITPITREEALLDGQDLTPITRKEQFIKHIYDPTQEIPEPVTREEWFLKKAGEGSSPVTIEALSVTENGIYSEAGKAYSPVTVEVPLPTNANERQSVTSYPVTDSANYPLPKCDVTVTDADKCEVIVTTDNTITEDSGVYLNRQSGGGNRELDEIVGGSVVWNQLISPSSVSASGTLNGITFTTNSDGSITLNGTASVGTGKVFINGVLTDPNHKYLILDANKSSGIDVYNGFIADSRVSCSVGGIITRRSQNWSPSLYLYVSGGTRLDNVIVKIMCTDLTALFGSTTADYIYSLEQSTAGSGIAWLKSYGYLTEDYYGYTANKIESVSVARHVMKDSNDSVIGRYAINPITLRGIPRLNASNQLYYDGDRYEASGRVTRKYGIRAYQSGDESLADAITDGTNTVYKLTTPTYEDSSPFEANQIVDANGTEEYIDAGVEAGTRDVAIPVGHDTKYFNGKAYVKPLTAGTSDTVSMADMGIMPTSPMYISANGSVDVEYWKSNS